MFKRILFLFIGLFIVDSLKEVYAVTAGDKAPLFEGQSTQGLIRLEDFLGRKHVVLAFYFADFTPV